MLHISTPATVAFVGLCCLLLLVSGTGTNSTSSKSPKYLTCATYEADPSGQIYTDINNCTGHYCIRRSGYLPHDKSALLGCTLRPVHPGLGLGCHVLFNYTFCQCNDTDFCTNDTKIHPPDPPATNITCFGDSYGQQVQIPNMTVCNGNSDMNGQNYQPTGNIGISLLHTGIDVAVKFNGFSHFCMDSSIKDGFPSHTCACNKDRCNAGPYTPVVNTSIPVRECNACSGMSPSNCTHKCWGNLCAATKQCYAIANGTYCNYNQFCLNVSDASVTDPYIKMGLISWQRVNYQETDLICNFTMCNVIDSATHLFPAMTVGALLLSCILNVIIA